MSRLKGCVNEKCELFKKKKFKERENYCSRCGTVLKYVCKSHKCFTFLEENDGEVCVRCEQKKQDAKDNRKKAAKKVAALGAGAAVIGPQIAKNGKEIVKFMLKK